MFRSIAPMLTEADPAAAAEGGIDPLGLYTISDALATRFVPGIRERQQHPRYLTALAASLCACESFGEDTIAADGVTEPWQVFEWYLVEGLMRGSNGEIRGVPGSLKATRAIREGVPLSAPRYLKTPSVFGIHGIYRLLSRDVGVEEYGRLGEFGCELLHVWSREQGLSGFFGSGGGNGASVKQQIVSSIRDALERGGTARSGGWGGWRFFYHHLDPHRAAPEEAKLIARALRDGIAGFRKEVFEFLVSKGGARIWKREEQKPPRDRDEAQLHLELSRVASSGLRELLDAIGAYERVARLLQDAFDDTLYEMTRQRGSATLAKLAELPNVSRAADQVPNVFAETAERLSSFGLATDFISQFAALAERCESSAWVSTLLDHHRRVQREKPPSGKNPWFEQSANRGVFIRSLYKRDEPGRGDYRYLHAYRTQPLWSFANDLGLLR